MAQITLGDVHIIKATNGDGPAMVVISDDFRASPELPIADWPKPQNILKFGNIDIRFLFFILGYLHKANKQILKDIKIIYCKQLVNLLYY
jgi:hypothetical protein